MASPAEPHRHRSTTKVSHKAFKSRHASKGAIKDQAKGRLEKDRWKKSYKSPHQQIMSKIDRKHHARQMRQQKHKEHEKSTSIFAGQQGAPRIVTVVPLTQDAQAKYAIEKLNEAVDVDVALTQGLSHSVRIERFKQSIRYVPVKRDLFSVLDACKIADYIVFILSSTKEVDERGTQLLRAIEGQGVSTVTTVVQELDVVEPAKKRLQVLASLKSFITHFFPTLEKVYSLDSRQECANIVRSLCTSVPKGVRWREDRSWMLVDECEWLDIGSTEEGQVILTGRVRGKGMKANRLLQVGDLGSFQIEKIVAAPLPENRKRKADEMAVDEQQNSVLDQPDDDQDDTADLAPEDIFMDDEDDMAASEARSERKGVLLDDHHYYSDDESHLPEPPKRVPKGTSSYQAAWYLGDESESGSDWEDAPTEAPVADADTEPLPQDGMEGLDQAGIEATEVGASEYPQSEMFLDPSTNDEAEQLAAYRSSRKNEAQEDLEFPDEIELHPNVLARERLARFRGLKSLRTSHWDTTEDRPYQPTNWPRLLQFSDYRAAKSAATREALVGGVKTGPRMSIYIRNVPRTFKSTIESYATTTNSVTSSHLTAFSLLRHEQKRTVVNYTITLSSTHPNPLKSKDPLILQSGPRRFIINPLFSDLGTTPNDVHKFQRYLHPGRTAIATFIAPLTWGSVPALFFQHQDPSSSSSSPSSPPSPGPLSLIATGTSATPSTSRVIAKRIILTGHPYKIHRKLVTVRYMFFNKEDVAWFKALQLWTRRGRSGFIKESLGTHGYFKATFDARINSLDAVGMSLYKRVWPREARALGVGDVEDVERVEEEGEDLSGEGKGMEIGIEEVE